MVLRSVSGYTVVVIHDLLTVNCSTNHGPAIHALREYAPGPVFWSRETVRRTRETISALPVDVVPVLRAEEGVNPGDVPISQFLPQGPTSGRFRPFESVTIHNDSVTIPFERD